MRAFRYRNYQLYFGGQSISWIGTWMQRVAMGWLVYRLTGSAFLLGFVEFLSTVPSFLLTPLTGVLSDRWNRYNILMVTQILAMIQAFMLAALTLTGVIKFWHIAAVSIFLGLVNALDVPTRHSFVADIIHDKNDLANAIALNSSVVNGARLIGPTIAGFIIAATNEGTCFLINGFSYFAIVIALFAMNITPAKKMMQQKQILHGLREGFSYAWHTRPIRDTLILLAVVALTAMPYTVIMPVVVKQIFHGDALELGFLLGASGVGALIGTIFLALRPRVSGIERLMALSSCIFGAGLIAFSFSTSLTLSIVLIMIAGFGMIVQLASSNIILQIVVTDDKRGRVMSLYTMAFLGMAPFGSLLIGSLTGKIGAPYTLLISGACCLAGALIFASRVSRFRMHPTFEEANIKPKIASGIQTATEISAQCEE